MTKFFFKFKKPYFWPISPIFEAKIVFPKIGAVMHNFIRVSGTMPKSSSKKTPSFQKRRMDTLFHRVFPGGLTSTIAVDWHLKVKDIEYDIGLTKNYCVTVSMQKISSIHKLIQQILGSHVLNRQAYF